MKESSERNSSREFLDALQPEFLQDRPATGQEDFCNEVSIELLPIKSNCQNSDSDFKVENPWESREPPRFFWPSGSFASFRNDKLTMRQKVAEAEGWWVGQRRRVNGVEEALVNDRSAFALISSSCYLFLANPPCYCPPACPVLLLFSSCKFCPPPSSHFMIFNCSFPRSLPQPHHCNMTASGGDSAMLSTLPTMEFISTESDRYKASSV